MEKKLKILVTNVCLRPYMPSILFPLGLSYIVGAVRRAGYDLELLDLDQDRKTGAEVEEFLKGKNYDVVLMGCIVTGYKIVKQLAKTIRQTNPKAVIIAGNSVADSIPRQLLENTEVDVAVLGEGEITIVEALDKLNQGSSLAEVKGIWFKQNGKIVANPKREETVDINNLPLPDWDAFKMEDYIEKMKAGVSDPLPMPLEQIKPFLINTARGCPFRCTFCYQVFQGYPYRHRPVDAIIGEIKELQKRYGVNYISFNDELSFPTKKYAEEFVERILAEDLKFFWMADCRSDLFSSESDLPFLERMKRSGCIGLGYSLESANADILKAMNKRLSLENFKTQKKLLDRAGITSWTSLVFGYPMETLATIKETMDMCLELGIYPSTGYLLPQPGTPMYDYILKNGLVKDEEEYLLSLGDRQDLRINLTKLDPVEFQAEIKKHLKRIADKLDLGLDESKLIKTVHYKVAKK